jgi:hypothetical protein
MVASYEVLHKTSAMPAVRLSVFTNLCLLSAVSCCYLLFVVCFLLFAVCCPHSVQKRP